MTDTINAEAVVFGECSWDVKEALREKEGNPDWVIEYRDNDEWKIVEGTFWFNGSAYRATRKLEPELSDDQLHELICSGEWFAAGDFWAKFDQAYDFILKRYCGYDLNWFRDKKHRKTPPRATQ